MKAVIIPKKKPAVTCVSECCRRIIRLDPTMPETKMERQSHQKGLKLSINEKAIKAPTTPPVPAVWVEIFQPMLMMAHKTCITKDATSIDVIR